MSINDSKVADVAEPLIPKKGEEDRALNGEQINYALELVEVRHKLLNTPMRVTWPFLRFLCCCFLKKRKPSFNGALKRAIRRKLELSVPKSDLRLEEDPFLHLGYGMNSYLEIIKELMILFALISVVSVPLMLTFAKFDALEDYPGFSMNKYTLGNIGGSDVFCAQNAFDNALTAFIVECPSETLITTTAIAQNTGNAILDFGIIPSTADVNTYCQSTSFTDEAKCSSYIDKAAFSAKIEADCVGKKSCQITKLNQFINVPAGKAGTAPCFDESAQMFVQVGCLVPLKDFETREVHALALGCAAVFVALFVVNYLDYISKVQQNLYVEWDVKTITSGDFTIEFDIDPEFFADWLSKEKDNWNSAQEAEGKTFTSDAESFRTWITAEMEKRVGKLPDLGYEDVPNTKVAVTTLAFKNGEIINLLRQRGTAIKTEKWDKQVEIEGKIQIAKSQMFDDLCTPCSIFMTWESEEGVNRALSYNATIDTEREKYEDIRYFVGDHEIEVQQASEPSDIIWENRQFTPAQRTKKTICVCLVMFLMLLGSFIAIFIFSGISGAALSKYPFVPDCSVLPGSSDEHQMEQAATLSYRANHALEEQGKKVSYQKGYLQCFCDSRLEAGDTSDQLYGDLELPICQDYFDSAFTTMLITNGISYLIIGINIILKSTTVSLITWIGYDTKSVMMAKITNGVFIALFFNMGILLVLTNANLWDVSEALSNVFSGTYYDYSPQWYATIGSTLVSTMTFNAWMPPIYEGIANGIAWLGRAKDSGWRCCKPKNERIYHTKSTQIYQYLDVYTGPDHIVHYKFSQVLTIAYITMLYGIGLPMLFPVGFLALFIYWATERYQIAYTYQLPPKQDDTMTINAINLLQYTPIIFLFNGYWMLSNKQMFENTINSLTYSNDQMSSGHGWSSVGDLDQATPLLLIACLMVVITICRVFFPQVMAKWGYSISSNVIEVDENLPNFFRAVKLSDADWIVEENGYYEKTYKLSFTDAAVVKRLDDWQLAKQPITGDAWYNILANPLYVRDFNYITASVKDRADYIVDGDSDEGNDCEQSDLVQILINLAYMETSHAKTFDFCGGYSKQN